MTVVEPTTVAALAAVLQEHPDALIVAGGTQLMRSSVHHAREGVLVSLRRVESLARVSRTQRHLDIGATVPLARILSIGPRVVPRSLFAALKATASPTVRVIATLGGNICATGVEHTSLAALAALDASLELRRGAAMRTLTASSFWRGGNELAVHPGEFLTRVRVPLREFELEDFIEEDVRWSGTKARVAVAIVAAVRKNAVEELKICYAAPWFGTLRFADFETACSGLRLPVKERSVDDLLAVLRRGVVQRLGTPMGAAGSLLAPVMRQASRFLDALTRGGAPLAEERPPRGGEDRNR